jgi:hypothetical protein
MLLLFILVGVVLLMWFIRGFLQILLILMVFVFGKKILILLLKGFLLLFLWLKKIAWYMCDK